MPTTKSYTTLHLNSFSAEKNILKRDHEYSQNLIDLVKPDADLKKLNGLINIYLEEDDNITNFIWHLN